MDAAGAWGGCFMAGAWAADLRASMSTKGAGLSSTHAPYKAALMLVNVFTRPEATDNNKLFWMNF